MTRPRKATVDYFPHSCEHGKTMFVLEETYGMHGYYFWFRLLELLGSTENHYIDCNNPASWRFLTSKTRSTPEKAEEILQCLSDMEAIDPELWHDRIIWSQNFVDGIADAYRNRKADVPIRPDFLRQKPVSNGINDVNLTSEIQKLNETKLNETKEKNMSVSPNGGNGHAHADYRLNEFSIFYAAYPRKEAKAKAIESWRKKIKAGKLPPLDNLIKSLEKFKQTKQWQENVIPHPSTWINQERWTDEINLEASDPWKELH